MKFLIDPDWGELASDMTDAELGEIFRCVLEYPHRDNKSPLWKFIKKQLCKDTIKYDEKCARLAKNLGRDNAATSDIHQSEIALTSDAKSQAISANNHAVSFPKLPAIQSIERNNTNKNIETENNALAVNRLIGGLARNMNPNKPKLYKIDDCFDLNKLYDSDQEVQDLYKRIPVVKVERGQQSLVQKKYGEQLTLEYIIKWIENEGKF
jgi:hypothetical protein